MEIDERSTDVEEEIDLETLEKEKEGLLTKADESAVPQAPKHYEIPVSKPLKITSQEDLSAAIASHRTWLESVLDPKKNIVGGRANFKDADLRGYDLSGVNLSGATFTGANLEGTDLTGGNFTAADFSHANLKGAKVAKTRFKRAIFHHANLIDADLSTSDLTHAQMQNAILVTPPTTEVT